MNSQDVNKIIARLDRLEDRVANLEKQMRAGDVDEFDLPADEESFAPASVTDSAPEVSMEVKIGEYWLAQLGAVVLILGIAFFISYPFEIFPAIVTSLLGYLSVAGILGLSRYWRKDYEYLSRILFGAGLLLLYFATLRLHFFSSDPVIANKYVGFLTTLAVLGTVFYLSLRRKSELLTSLAFLLGYATSVIFDTLHVSLTLVAVLSAAAAYVFSRYTWQKVFVQAIVLTYFSFLLWLLNNPLIGKPIQALAEHQNILIYLYLYCGIFASARLLQTKTTHSDFFEILLASLNSIAFFALNFLVAITFFKDRIVECGLGAAVFLIGIAALNWLRHQSRFAAAVYANFGYLALSIAIFSQFKSPDYFIWLSWQSLLVVSTAIWFRSRIIIVANTLIYLGILFAYLAVSPSHDFINLSYALVALTSARVLNWQKGRLQLTTDMLRNAYLISAFVVVLYGLYHVVPGNYISLSWLGAALFYFAMSLVLKNMKYRWLAILTLFAVLIHVFVIDMARLSAGYRILLLLAVGLVLLVVSLFYARFRKKLY